MKTEWRIFAIVAAFLLVVSGVYPAWTYGQLGHVEWIGTVALILSFLLCTMCGGFFWFVSRRIDLRPEDRPDAEVADGAGLVFWQWWLIIFGLLAVIAAAAGLLFEYYTGTRRTAEH